MVTNNNVEIKKVLSEYLEFELQNIEFENSGLWNYKYDPVTFGTKKAMFYLRKNDIDISIELKSENEKLVITIKNEKSLFESNLLFFPTYFEIENGMLENEDGDFGVEIATKNILLVIDATQLCFDNRIYFTAYDISKRGILPMVI
jgi:hypothetical protein